LEKILKINSLEFAGKLIYCQKGDITESQATAIVNAANSHLWMGSGVAGAIKNKGGKSIEDEAVKKGPIQIGETAVTGGGKLKAKYVIHAAVMGQDLRANSEYIRKATANSLKQAEKLRLASIDFPALGTGVGGFPVSDCARVMMAETLLFLKSSTHVKIIGFTLFSDDHHQAFLIALKALADLV
jgi:O-acetyl-ADP-ribose deacetylase (regulator of RNase III)